MAYKYENYDIAVVGAGHAGCEAALACARLGLKTIVFTVSIESIALMPCNPNIGGSSKGHLVREIDALGGQMGKTIDATFIQSKMLNSSKGPAVHSLRAQADKANYSRTMRQVLQKQENLEKVPQNLPILMVSGAEDPVGDYGKGVHKACDSLKRAGVKNITVKLYENDRHELLNEDDAEVAMEDIWQWICKEIPGIA